MLFEENDFPEEKNIQKIIDSLQQQNLVYNYNFLYFSNKKIESSLVIYGHPDGWQYSDPGPGSQITFSNESCRIVTSSDDKALMTFEQALHEIPRWETKLRGKTVTAKVHMNLSTGANVTAALSDGIVTSSKTVQVGGDVDVELQLTVNDKAEKLHITIESSSSSAAITISKVYANIGAIAIENLPCIVQGIIGERKSYISTENPPAGELSLCEAAAELGPNYSRLDTLLNGKFGRGPNNKSMLPDIRGYFSRSWNNGSAIDPDASTRTTPGNESLKGDFAGTVEDDAFREHLHKIKYLSSTVVTGKEAAAPVITPAATDTEQTENTGGSETRPKNIAELYTIKWA
ncbi:MAG: hypothetical protein GY757_59605 [bacterium]|nr:hypothetical protein [bacterium]